MQKMKDAMSQKQTKGSWTEFFREAYRNEGLLNVG